MRRAILEPHFYSYLNHKNEPFVLPPSISKKKSGRAQKTILESPSNSNINVFPKSLCY